MSRIVEIVCPFCNKKDAYAFRHSNLNTQCKKICQECRHPFYVDVRERLIYDVINVMKESD